MDVDNNAELHFKTFLDSLMISKAERCGFLSIWVDYGVTQFAMPPTLIGDKKCEVIKNPTF